MTIPTHLTASQLDGHACVRCTREYGPDSTSTPATLSDDGRQLFACSDGWGCSAEVAEWIDLLCSTCNAIIGTVSAPAPTVPIRCQQCRRDPSCASWCSRADGHADELFDSDRICYADGECVPLTVEPSPGLGTIASIEISPLRRPGGRDTVYAMVTQRRGDTDFDMTVTEARQLAALLLAVAEQVETEGVRQ
ncbi:DUF6907 domain-containing protein [Nocardia gipuzkoensis]|uniref:DUF6907 domain-containing protein n=1 Tax=Nocardia gipuzkoensis TaxID=2749991 RepID=UPI00237D6F5C|nr:hypothetical protein [Nocardia gipuzkoensis]MDE1668830.1 hypothetical protein [Nocardia gipuzkoensis]